MVGTTDLPSQRECLHLLTCVINHSRLGFRYILNQNLAISKREIKEKTLNLQVLGIGDGLTVRCVIVLYRII
jgi:hypothetical protein